MIKQWKQMIALFCTVIMITTIPCISLLADELLDEGFIVTEAEQSYYQENGADVCDTGLTGSDAAVEEFLDTYTEEIVGENEIEIGKGVTATFDTDTCAVVIYSNGGTLYEGWQSKFGNNQSKITSLRVSETSTKVCFTNVTIGGLREFPRLSTVDFHKFDLSNVTYMSGLFSGCNNLTSVDFGDLDTSNVSEMDLMFNDCPKLTYVDLSGLDTSNVSNMGYMFFGCTGLTSVNFNGLNTSNVTSMDSMFYNCRSLTSLDLSSFDTSNVGCMNYMFYNCRSLTSLDLSNFDTSSLTSIEFMFSECKNLEYADLSNFNLALITGIRYMFDSSPNLLCLKTPKYNNADIMIPVMYDESGNRYNTLPKLSHSITLTKINPRPTLTPTPTITPTPTLTPTPTPTPSLPPAASGFSDVQDLSHPYYNAIYWAAEAGITKGYPDGTFGINRKCTRGEMMMFLWRYAGKPAPKPASKSPFKDVATTHVFYKAILWGSQKGITKGYSDGTFGIDRNVSRGECMMFLWRLKGKPAPKTIAISPFYDVKKTHVFYKAILWGSQKGITKGYTSGPKKGSFGINDNCLRGQIVTFLYRAK